MALWYYQNSETGEITSSLKALPEPWVKLLTPPHQKFMVKANAVTGASKLKDQQAVLTARARNHSRDVDSDETIQTNLANGLKTSVATNLLNEKGERRRKIDDI